MSDPQPLRIVHVASPAAYGGLERVVQNLATGQRAAGAAVTVAAVVSPGTTKGHVFIDELRASQVSVEPIEVSSRAYLRERRLIGELLRRLAPNIVHTHGYRPDVLDAPVARGQGIPTVTTVHGFTGGDWKNLLFEYLDRRAMRRFDAVVAVSGKLAAQLAASGVNRARLEHIPNAWTSPSVAPLERAAARAALGVDNGAFTIGWVGRLTREKGADVLLDALAQVRQPAWNAVVFGDGAELPDLERQAARLGMGARVRWQGAVPAVQRFYRAFDVFVLSSRTEGIPIVLFEAMSAGVPVVATAVGGVPEVLTDAEARLVPSEDARALAAAIDAVGADHAAAAVRAGAARHLLTTRFDTRSWIARYDAVYRRVMKSPRRAT